MSVVAFSFHEAVGFGFLPPLILTGSSALAAQAVSP